ncbi:hypothetical protein J2Z32_003715 [Paenibacillus turicensis]|uniref:Uncharacterized protein n=1 Tax=Paenibacillus turicensis TaxID=160487 RepID=A0ABS4FWU8_9BACL|nr:hypothetical protein [Paenibacillus turicensis]MBP1907050.1 hypothetical protein [Paenibacillus turicensis]
MIINYLEPWIKNRTEEVIADYEEKKVDVYNVFISKLELIKMKTVDNDISIILLELEELFNQHQEELISEIYHQAFEESFNVALSIYK